MRTKTNIERMIGYVNSAKDAQVKYPFSYQIFCAMTANEKLSQQFAAIRAAKTHDERQALKQQLPAILFQGQRSDGKDGPRKDAELIPTGLGIIDIDHCEPRATYALFAEKCPTLKACERLSHITPSGEGLRLVLELPEGMTIPQMQQTVAEQMGVAVDSSTKNLGRLSYIPMKEEILYVDEHLFDPVPLNPPCQATPSSAPQPQPQASAGNSNYRKTHEGIELAEIWRQLFLLQHGEPTMGCRHDRMKAAAPIMAYLYNYDAEWMTATAPTYGLTTEESHGIMQWACSLEHKKRMPKQLKDALQRARQADMLTDMPPAYNWSACRLPMINLFAKKAPWQIRASVVESLWPALATHSNIDYKYIDGQYKHVVFQCGNIAESSTGKSFCNTPENIILEPLKLAAKPRKERLEEWKREALVAHKGHKKAPARPTDVYEQVLPFNMTNAYFTQAVDDAYRNGGVNQIVKVDEIDLLRKITEHGQIAELDTLLCIAFDCSPWQQGRVSAEGVNGDAPLHLNVRYSCVPSKAARYFGNAASLVDGPVSRQNFCTTYTGIPYNGEDFQQGDYDQAFRDELQIYLDRLAKHTGLIECPEAYNLAKRMKKEIWQRGDMCDNDTLMKLASRSAEIGFRKALMLYVMNDCVWTKAIEKYVRWSVDYDLWVKMHYLGKAFEDAIHAERLLSQGVNANTLQCPLPNPFSLQQYLDWKGNTDGLRQWVHRKKVVQDESTNLYWFAKKS